ncbi:MAG: adenosine-specific kinase [Candidatus Thermoplasmatota archaeon]
MEISSVRVEIPEGANVVIGQSHFIKTVEDIYEAVVGTVPQAKFGVAFCEASGPCLIRTDGNDEAMKKAAQDNAARIGAGHTFVIVLKDAYPINILDRVKAVQEVCCVFCATANPLDVVVANNERGRGIVGVIDGERPKGVEGAEDAADRKAMLRKFGYKR